MSGTSLHALAIAERVRAETKRRPDIVVGDTIVDAFGRMTIRAAVPVVPRPRDPLFVGAWRTPNEQA